MRITTSRASDLIFAGIKALCMVIIVLTSLATLYIVGPGVETGLFPVTSKLTIQDLVTVEGGIEFRFSYSKNRDATCVLAYTTMTIDGQQVDFYVKPGQAPPIPREAGIQLSRIWFAGTPTLDGAEIKFLHQCPGIPWISVTRVYP